MAAKSGAFDIIEFQLALLFLEGGDCVEMSFGFVFMGAWRNNSILFIQLQQPILPIRINLDGRKERGERDVVEILFLNLKLGIYLDVEFHLTRSSQKSNSMTFFICRRNIYIIEEIMGLLVLIFN